MGYPSFVHVFTYGDLRPYLVGTFPWSISGHTIELDIVRPDGSLLTKEATIDVAADGTFHFEWEAGDLQVGMNQLCAIRDIFGDDKPYTSPDFFIHVKAKKAATA